MKKMLRGAVAAIALATAATGVQAQTLTVTELTFGVGTVYNELVLSFGDTETASPTVTQTFALSGTVNSDCSYYGGGTNAQTVPLGTIGVETSSNTAVNNAFDMVGPLVVNILSATAGCNTNNTVTITKDNGTNGLVNAAPAGYDSNQFQANIPYVINANWVGTQTTNGPDVGTGQSLTLGVNEDTDTWTGGAWRSAFNLNVLASPPPLALVAGNYSDTITLTLQTTL